MAIVATTYEPKYYERRALAHLAQIYQCHVLVNVRYPAPRCLFRNRPEIDGIIDSGDGLVAVEVKSYPLTDVDIEAIVSKYSALAFRKLLVVAPDLPRLHKKYGGFDCIDFVRYEPDDELLWDWYDKWRDSLPSVIAASFYTGRHSFRYVMTRAGRRGRIVANQVDKRIRTVAHLVKDINRFRFPPYKILWSPSRWSVPKDLYYRKARSTMLGGFLVIDIDGTSLHEAMHPCELLPNASVCPHCMKRSLVECKRALGALQSGRFHPVAVFGSGNRGYHIYVETETVGVRDILCHALHDRGVVFDISTLVNPKSFVTFPTSLNAATMCSLEPLGEIAGVYPKE